MKKTLLIIICTLLIVPCTAQSAQVMTVRTGASFTIPSAVAASSGATYRWLENGTLIPGATGAAYSTTKTQEGRYEYIRQAKTPDCADWMSSNPVTVYVRQILDFEVSPPTGNEPVGTMWYLTDGREPNNIQRYKVKKMPDGHIWMVQDLKFGDKCGTKTTFAGSNGSDKTNGNYTSLPGTWYGDCRNNSQAGAGYLYDWAATMQKSGAYAGSTADVGCSGTAGGTAGKNPAACRGICPEGWHIPTGGTAGEFKALYDKYSAGTCVADNYFCWGPNSAFEGALNGWCESNGALNGQSWSVVYFSSTFYSSTEVYALYARTSDSDNGTRFAGNTKQNGYALRCVMNY
jgi:uncharacterized protein (TIGR02145 family)